MSLIGVKKGVTGAYPKCEICGGSLHRPCTIAWETGNPQNGEQAEADGIVACVACYRVWLCLGRMAQKGLLVVIK